jgi:sulfotransferase family protein
MENIHQTKYVFICSAGHSGSTLLDMLIGSHAECESLGEVVLLPMEFATNRTCTCGVNIRECKLWSEVARRLGLDTDNDPYALHLGYLKTRSSHPWLLNAWSSARTRLGYGMSYYRYFYGLTALDTFVSVFNEMIENTFLVYDAVRDIAHKQIVVDSSKHHTRAAAVYSSRPASVRIILLVRDGRGVFYSGLKRGFGRRNSLRVWRRHYARALPLLRKTVDPKHIMELRYENLVAKPDQTLDAVCQFLGIPYDPSMTDFRAFAHHNVNGNDMRYDSLRSIRLDDAWKTHLSQSDLRYFEKRAGVMNRQLGYE